MNEDQFRILMKYRQANWPAAALTKDLIEVFRMECGPLDFDEALGTLRSHFATRDFPPTPFQLRDAVIRASLPPSPDVDELIDHVLRLAAEHGRYTLAAHPPQVLPSGAPVPRDQYGVALPVLMHEAEAEFVRRRGGWDDVCSGPTRDTTDAQAQSAFNTWRAQARDDLKVLIARVEEAMIERKVAELEAPPRREIEGES